jgi:hypothetical protein
VQLALRDRTDAGEGPHGQGRQHRAFDPRWYEHHATRLGQARRHLRHDLARREAGARGETELVVDRSGELEDRTLDGNVAVLITTASVQTLAPGQVEEHLIDARDHHRGRVTARDLPYPFGVFAVRVAAGRQIDRVGCELAGLDQRHARLHAESSHLVARGRDHSAATGPTANDDRLALERRVEHTLDRHEESVQIEAADPGQRQRPRLRELRSRRHDETRSYLSRCSGASRLPVLPFGRELDPHQSPRERAACERLPRASR